MFSFQHFLLIMNIPVIFDAGWLLATRAELNHRRPSVLGGFAYRSQVSSITLGITPKISDDTRWFSLREPHEQRRITQHKRTLSWNLKNAATLQLQR